MNTFEQDKLLYCRTVETASSLQENEFTTARGLTMADIPVDGGI